jgi:hypothetical protein
MKNLFAALGERGRLDAIARSAPELVRAVEEAPRITWLPVSLNVRTVEVVSSQLGEGAGLELLADCVYAQFETPLWRDFIGGAVRLLGRDPGSLGRWIPHAMRLVFRDCGVWAAERTGEGCLRVAVHSLPETLAGHRLWLRSLGVGMRPLFPLCETDGTADLAELDSGARRAAYEVAWKPDGG